MRFLFLLITIQSSFASEVKKSCIHSANSFRCVQYIRNYDADTVTFNIPSLHPIIGEKINVRVSGIDTPEIRTKNTCEKSKAYIAKDYVTKILKAAKNIDLINVQRGKYFRVVADVIIDGKSLGKQLLKKGMAYHYDGGTKKKVDWCLPTRKIASQNKLNLKTNIKTKIKGK